MNALGRQILVEFYDCNSERLNDCQYIGEEMEKAVIAAKATVVSKTFHHFSPFGVSGVIVIAESHVAIHTWPEYQYAAVDIFTCGETIDPWVIHDLLKTAFESGHASQMEIKRGIFNLEHLAHKAA